MEIKFPTLSASDIEVKIKKVAEGGAVALLYKTARTDMAMLDEHVGPLNWQSSYEEIKGNLYCTISVWDADKGMWVGKSDCGIESREDGEGNEKKGEASDAFKRAGFRWGIGRELYSAPFIFLKVATKKVSEDGRRPVYELADKFASFGVSHIGYDENSRINALTIINEKNGEVVYSLGSSAKGTAQEPQKKNKPEEQPKQDKQKPGRAQMQSDSRKVILTNKASKLFSSVDAYTAWVLGYLDKKKAASVDTLTEQQFFDMLDEMEKVNGNP